LKSLQRQVDDGLPPPDTQLTVAELLRRWHHDLLRHQVSSVASSNHRSVAEQHIVPALGKRPVAKVTAADIDALMPAKLDGGGHRRPDARQARRRRTSTP
jgi:hypothetical protein